MQQDSWVGTKISCVNIIGIFFLDGFVKCPGKKATCVVWSGNKQAISNLFTVHFFLATRNMYKGLISENIMVSHAKKKYENNMSMKLLVMFFPRNVTLFCPKSLPTTRVRHTAWGHARKLGKGAEYTSKEK